MNPFRQIEDLTRREIEDLNQNFEHLRQEAKRRQRIYEGIRLDAAGNPILHTTFRDADGKEKTLPFAQATLKQPPAAEASKFWGLEAAEIKLFTLNERDVEELNREVEQLGQAADAWARREAVKFDHLKEGAD